jgi:drug/metabolite transporter (DMT)-like permease
VSETEPRRGMSFSVAGALCSAIYLFPYKWAAELATPDVLAFALLCAAAFFNTLCAAWEGRAPAPVLHSRSLSWQTAGLLAVLTISGNFCGAQAIARLDPAVTSVLLRTEVVFVGGLAALLLGERLSLALICGAGLALAGLGLMRWPLARDSSGLGTMWALGAAASFGAMQVVTRRVIHRISPAKVNAARLWIACGALLLVPGLLGSAIAAGSQFWLRASLAALFGPCLGRLFIMYSLRGLRAAHSALLLLLAPLFAFAIGYLIWGSVPTSKEVLGGALMLIGIGLPSLSGLLAERRQGRGPL